MSNFREGGARYSFQTLAVGKFATMREGIGVVDYLRVTGAGTIELKPKLAAENHPTETFEVEAGHYVGGQFVELVAASPACFPIDVQGW